MRLASIRFLLAALLVAAAPASSRAEELKQVLAGLAGRRDAVPPVVRTPAESMQALIDVSGRAGISAHQRDYQPGRGGGNVKRLVLYPKGDPQLKALSEVLNPTCNVLELMHCGYDKFQSGGRLESTGHTFGIFNRKAPHVNATGGYKNWYVNDLGWGNLRASDKRAFSGMIQLTPSEAKRFQQSVDLCYALQQLDNQGYWVPSQDRLAQVKQRRPDLFEDEHVVANASRMGARDFYCTGFFTDMKLGDNGERLWQLIGLSHSYNGNPRGCQAALETEANERVFGLAVYHGTMPERRDRNVFYFEPDSLK